jgi:hypothetical protein
MSNISISKMGTNTLEKLMRKINLMVLEFIGSTINNTNLGAISRMAKLMDLALSSSLKKLNTGKQKFVPLSARALDYT